MVSRKFEATSKSLGHHQVPDWFHDAKFGIFIHWTPSSIPAFAPANADITELVRTKGPAAMFSHSPYSEWYLNSLRIKDSPVHAHHVSTYGEDYAYENFAPSFNGQIEHWDPDAWASLFHDIHAKYVVLVTKHHDGFLMWPARTRHPERDAWHAPRNVVGELTESVRAHGLRMGFYYSGALDWSFTSKPITSFSSLASNGPSDRTYARYVDAHYRELIDDYVPDLLWNDIAYPARSDLKGLLAYYYNQVEEGLVNDRWQQLPGSLKWLLKIPAIRRRAEAKIAAAFVEGTIPPPKNIHTDYSTPEYITLPDISDRKWECVRGIGHSFGYNATEPEENFLSGTELIRMLVDIVSKNGNLLLNIGPRPDGSIPSQQLTPLAELGEWLGANGEAIFATRPWVRATGTTDSGDEVHFTRGCDAIYVFVCDTSAGDSLCITDFDPGPGASATWLATGEPLQWYGQDGACQVQLPDKFDASPVDVIKFAHTENPEKR